MTELLDQELLIKACEKLGVPIEQMEICKCGDPRKGHTYEHAFHPIMDGLSLPPLLISLDAHFAPGGTVEWMRERGYRLILMDNISWWSARFRQEDENRMSDNERLLAESKRGRDENPATAITKAFVQHEEGKP